MGATVQGIKAGRAYVLIDAIDKTGAVLNTVGGKFKNFAAKMTALGQGVLSKSLMAAAPIALSAKRFIDFDDALRRVEAKSEGTVGQMAALREEAKRLGLNSAYSAVQIGDMMQNLAQKGFDRSQILAMSQSIVNLAQATGSGVDLTQDAVQAADLVSGTLRAFKMEATDAAKVADIMTQAANASNLTLEDLITSLSYAGPVAKQYGVSLEDTVAVMGQLANLNIRAETSGTAFRNMLLEMSNPKERDKFNKMLKDAGVDKQISFVDEMGNLRQMPNILLEIGDAIKHLGTAEQGHILYELFGKRALVPATAIATGKNAFLDMQKAMHNYEGAAKKASDITQGGIGGVWRRFLASIEGLALAIGDGLAPDLERLGIQITTFLRNFTAWASENKTVLVSILALVLGGIALGASLLVVGMVVGSIGATITGLGVAFSTCAAILGFFATPLGWVVAGIAVLTIGLAALLYYLYQTNTTFQAWANNLGSTFVGLFAGIGDTARTTIGGVISAIMSGRIGTAWAIVCKGLQLGFFQLIDNLAKLWHGWVMQFKVAWIGVLSIFKRGLIEIGTLAKAKFYLQTGQLGKLAGLPGERDRKIKENRAETIKATLAEMGKEEGGSKLRKMVIDQLKYELDQLVASLKTPEKPPEQPTPKTPKAMEDQTEPPDKDQSTGIPPSIIQGLEMGSVDAARQFAENRQNTLEAKTLKIAEDSLEVLKAIDKNLVDGVGFNLV